MDLHDALVSKVPTIVNAEMVYRIFIHELVFLLAVQTISLIEENV